MATSYTPAPLKSVLLGFVYNFDTERTISIGSTDGDDDIMVATLIPAGMDYFPLPVKKALNWNVDPYGVPVYFNGIEDTEDIYSPKFLP